MKRVVTALVLLPFIVWVILWANYWVFVAVLATLALLCFYEYEGIVDQHAVAKPGPFAYAVGIAVLFAPRIELIFVVVVALLTLALALRFNDMSDCLPWAGALLLGLAYVFGCWHFALELRTLNPWWLLFAVALNWAGDIAAYYVGRAIGRHRLAPVVSPKKSWEGAIASVLASLAFAALFIPRALPSVPLWAGLVAGGAGNIAGQFGDLCESALKRGAGLKDSGTLLPGHGGWLDRVDSTLFAMPVVYALATWLGR
ncbi:MAG TPA: phosphatidate cytidylyltransferase [Bryobacteraceae bacterium]|nr:phosphatidate cytidylyltransferase [Bryobacteraceae bacterium]